MSDPIHCKPNDLIGSHPNSECLSVVRRRIALLSGTAFLWEYLLYKGLFRALTQLNEQSCDECYSMFLTMW